MLYLLKKANQQTNKTKVRDVFKKKPGGGGTNTDEQQNRRENLKWYVTNRFCPPLPDMSTKRENALIYIYNSN